MSYPRSKSLPVISTKVSSQRGSSGDSFSWYSISEGDREKLSKRSSLRKKMKYFFDRLKKSPSGSDTKSMQFEELAYKDMSERSFSDSYTHLQFEVIWLSLYS